MMNEAPYREDVNISKLFFDEENPRLPYKIRKNPSQRSILEWIVGEEGVLDLVYSIGIQDFFDGEALLVIPRLDGDGASYTVVEGNRRLGALKVLDDPSQLNDHPLAGQINQAVAEAKFRPQTVPVVIYKNRNETLKYLGFRHITGVKAWSPLAKARYLRTLAQHLNVEDKKIRNRELAKIIGSNANYVAKLLAGLHIYDEIEQRNFFGVSLDDEQVEFSLITTALSYSNISEFLGLENAQDDEAKNLNTEHLSDFTRWVFDRSTPNRKTRLEDSRNLGNLNKIVANSAALEHFNKGATISEAVLLTDVPVESFRTLLRDIKQRMQALTEVQVSIKTYDQSDLDLIQDIESRVKQVRLIVRGYLEE